ncbi:MAG: amidohydrolase family protein [Eudoraea sp.]|uniref:amidohydrolase family protein n=1 Tax=Eudoraea sp. TaxID=1979955 RepID=UPI003C72C9C6
MNSEDILHDYSLVVKGGIIQKIESTSSFETPKGVRTIDATGKYLIPGLSDMHVHLEGLAWNVVYQGNNGYTPEQLSYEHLLLPYIAHGITSVNVMSAFPELLVIRDSINKGKLLGPQLTLSKMIDGSGKAWPPPISTWVNNPQEAKNAVIETKNLGYDRIKVYSFLDKDCYDTIVKTSLELGIPVDGHIPRSTSIEYIAKSGQSMIAHSEELLNFVNDFNTENIESISKLLVDNEIWITATLITTNNLLHLLEDPNELNKEGTEFQHPQAKDVWNFVYQNLYKPMPASHREYLNNAFSEFQKPFIAHFQEEGGKILAGTDALVPPTLPGISLHHEMELLVEAGLTPYEALKTATINPQLFLENEKAGIVEEGKSANLVLLAGNPLEHISNTQLIEGVFIQNQWINKTELKEKMNQVSKSFRELKRE